MKLARKQMIRKRELVMDRVLKRILAVDGDLQVDRAHTRKA